MLTLFIIGIVVLVIKVVFVALKATWGITKVILSVLGLPIILIGLVVAGLIKLALPVLVIALVAAFLLPRVVK